MAVNEFGDTIIEQPASGTVNEFGDPIQSSATRVSGRVPTTPGQGVFRGDSAYKDLFEAIPFYGSPSEFRAGQRSGEQLAGTGIVGDVVGGGLGLARALNTLFNPIGKTINIVPQYTQAAGSVAGGDLNAALRDLTGSNPISSGAEFGNLDTGIGLLDTTANTLGGIYNEAIAKQPVSLAGLTPAALRAQGTALRNFPSNVAAVSSDAASLAKTGLDRAISPLRGAAKVDPLVVEKLTRDVADAQQKLDSFKGEQTAESLKAAEDLQIAQRELVRANEIRNAQNLTLEERLQQLQSESEAARAEAIAANTDIGAQIEGLNISASEVPGLASALRESLPAPEGPAQFGRGISESISSEAQKAKPQLTENYQAVKDSIGGDMPQMEASNLHNAAVSLSLEESAGLQSLGDSRINNVLKDASKVRTIDDISPQARDIYDRLPDNQKQSFLDQMGGGITKETRRTYNWDDLQKTYQRLNDKISDAERNQDNNAVRILSNLKEAVSKDMASYAESIGTDTKALFDQANAEFAANRQKFGTSRITPLISELARETPENIASKIVGPKKASVINNLREILPPEKFQQVQSQFADQLFSPSKDVPFDPTHFVKEFNKIDNETLQATFGEEGFKQLSQINELSKASEQSKVLQSSLDEFNNKAQKAQDSYLKAKTAADEGRILEGVKSEAEKAVDSARERIREIEREQKGTRSQERLDRMKRDLDDAVKSLEKAKTPEQVSLSVRTLYAAASFAGLTLTGYAAIAPVAAAMAFGFGRMVHRNVGAPILDALIKKK